MSSQDGRAGSRETRDTSLTRRALIRAGWIIPAVLVVSLPSKAFAAYGAPQLTDPSMSGGANFTAGGAVGGVTISASGGASGSASPPSSH